MLKYLIKKQVPKNVVPQKGKKAMIYGGTILAGAGIYFSYKAIQNHKKNKDDYNYLDNEYNMYDYNYGENYKEDNEDDELEEKVEEFNSRRINQDNCPHVEKEEMKQHLNNVQDNKENAEIDKEQYKEGYYDKYELYKDNELK
ncbi:hypothetical protein CHF27_000025 [Romboutsia maritimum]|uniref:Uncharacterized protein n=1 Tax=Romboutsia maritimum TaxID=2020948 RepID=A0A371IVW3_9FIRM|nr:hypothetical protein [Romboutsia maritimum]RDY24623.1 hypothetical protein CHF27_000025 [Romboutsia maritimum]